MIDTLDIVRKASARRMKLSVDPRTGRVRLVLPAKAALAPALQWAEAHEAWIAQQKARLPAPWPITPGMAVPLAGTDHVLDWQDSHPRTPSVDHGWIRIGGPLDRMPARLLRWLKTEAHKLLEAETRAIAAEHDILVRAVGVGDPRSRWGSCSSSGDIRYSWRLILAPDYVRRATVTHELAHRIHMDHSRAFHSLAARLYGGDPAPARHWLRRHGAQLYWFGRAD
ncbi:MAG: M48 family metallopeptidase [Chakrabartia sp.]